MALKKSSIAEVVIFWLVTVATLLLTVFGTLNYKVVKDEHWARLRIDHEVRTDQLASGIAVSVWNLDGLQIDRIMESVMKDRAVYGVVVTEKIKTHVLARDEHWQPVFKDSEFAGQDLLVEERPISYNGETIGSVRLFVTPKFVNQYMSDYLISTIMMIIWIDLILILALYLLLWRTVLRPLKVVEQYAGAVSSGDEASIPVQIFGREFESLRFSIEKMVAQQKARFEELQQSEQRFRVLVEQAPEAIAVYDVDLDLFVDVNSNAARLFGCSPQELLKTNPKQFYSSSQPDGLPLDVSIKHYTDRALAGEMLTYERAIQNEQGKELLCEVRLARLPSADRKLIRISYVDITERKWAEKLLIKSQAHLQTLVQTIPDLVWLKDPDGVYLDCNPMFERFFGVKKEAIIGKTDYDFVERELADFFREHDQKAIEVGEPCRNEEWLALPDGGRRVLLDTIKTPMFDAGGKLVGVLGIGRDITSRKLSEEALRFTQFAIDKTIDQAFWMVEGGKLIYVNDAACRSLEYTREELLKLSVPDFSPMYLPEKFAQHWDDLREKGACTFEATHRTKSGRVYPVEVRANHVVFDGKEYHCSFVTDITMRKRAEEEKIKLQAQLSQAQKMEAIGTLAGGIAHDFNNYLSVILGYADMAIEDAPSGSKFKNDLTKITAAANRAKELVKQILTFSRQTRIERIPLNIQSLIKEGLKLLRSSIPATISIVEEIEVVDRAILADPTQIHQILMNLCTNASHAMEASGGILNVSLKTTFIETEDQKKGLHIKTGEYVELSIIDTGPGIAPDIIDKIFDPYFTTKEIGKGTGMGLAIIHGIMKEYGGTITVESKEGHGAAFRAYFPVVEADVAAEIVQVADLVQGKERILFVDDEQLLAEMGKDMLERLGYHVTVRGSSAEALTTFQNTPNEFDVVITDQTMPDMTGADLARLMLQIRPDIPIILCTGYSNLIDEHSAKALGIREFALKPLTRNVLAELIRNVLQKN